MNGKINKDNYEAFVLDYMEGTLSGEDAALLEAFVALHPELDIDLNAELVSLEPEEIRFNEKGGLKKNTPFISDEQFVGYLENVISAEERTLIEQAALADAGLKKELELYKKTILTADASVVFPDKALLKREANVIRFALPAYLSAAAAVTLLLGLWFLFKNPTGITLKGQALSLINTQAQFQQTVSFDVDSSSNPDVASNRETGHFVAGASRTPHYNTPETVKDSLADPVHPVANHAPEKNTASSNETMLAAQAPATTTASTAAATPAFMVAVGSDDEETAPVKTEKNSFWAKASKIFRSLNKLGAKKVNAVEIVERKEEQYVLSLGNFSIQKNKYNQ
ncbi:MAG: hypothetical protein ACXVP0_10115 [Bacteroidia bacterium]